MNLNHFTISNETNHGVLWNKIDALLQRVLKFNHVLTAHNSVNDQYEDWTSLCRCLGCLLARNDVLESSLIRHELKWKARITNIVGIVWWEIIFGNTNWTHPSLIFEV